MAEISESAVRGVLEAVIDPASGKLTKLKEYPDGQESELGRDHRSALTRRPMKVPSVFLIVFVAWACAAHAQVPVAPNPGG